MELRWTCRGCLTEWASDLTPEECIRPGCDSSLRPVFADLASERDAALAKIKAHNAAMERECASRARKMPSGYDVCDCNGQCPRLRYRIEV